MASLNRRAIFLIISLFLVAGVAAVIFFGNRLFAKSFSLGWSSVKTPVVDINALIAKTEWHEIIDEHPLGGKISLRWRQGVSDASRKQILEVLKAVPPFVKQATGTAYKGDIGLYVFIGSLPKNHVYQPLSPNTYFVFLEDAQGFMRQGVNLSARGTLFLTIPHEIAHHAIAAKHRVSWFEEGLAEFVGLRHAELHDIEIYYSRMTVRQPRLSYNHADVHKRIFRSERNRLQFLRRAHAPSYVNALYGARAYIFMHAQDAGAGSVPQWVSAYRDVGEVSASKKLKKYFKDALNLDVETAGLMNKKEQSDYLETCLNKIQDPTLPEYEKLYYLTGLSYYRHRSADFFPVTISSIQKETSDEWLFCVMRLVVLFGTPDHKKLLEQHLTEIGKASYALSIIRLDIDMDKEEHAMFPWFRGPAKWVLN